MNRSIALLPDFIPCRSEFSSSGCRMSCGTSELFKDGIDGIGDAQLVFESLLHQVEIKPRDFQFFAKGYLMRARSLQRESQQVAELGDHGIRQPYVLVHHRRNRVQGVEKKVWLELQAQIFQLCLHQLGLEFSGGKL